ncbi:UNVERIFIED_CONTAM: hypothetical protein H355_003566 [Colinus virginianus]|nr:hypothetical protein H355_003566 [Colinus virginianus]
MSGVCAVAKEGDLIVGDSRLHASLRSGIQLSGAKSFTFRHNNWQHLQLLLCKHRRKYRNCWIVVESVYSMDGDIADLPTVRKLADQHNCRILVDEAHGLGVLGKTGRGLEEHFNMPYAADVIVGTFSKSIAGVGGYIVGDDDLVEYLDFHAPGSVFSAPLTSYSAGGAIKAFELMQGEQSWRIQKAQRNAKYLRRALQTGNGHWPPQYPAECKYELEGMDCTTVIPVVYPNDGDRSVPSVTCRPPPRTCNNSPKEIESRLRNTGAISKSPKQEDRCPALKDPVGCFRIVSSQWKRIDTTETLPLCAAHGSFVRDSYPRAVERYASTGTFQYYSWRSAFWEVFWGEELEGKSSSPGATPVFGAGPAQDRKERRSRHRGTSSHKDTHSSKGEATVERVLIP